MDALRRAHRALVPGGILLDMLPVAVWPAVECRSGRLGRLDCREFAGTIHATSKALAQAVREGLFRRERTLCFHVVERFESADRLLEIVGGWSGTRIPPRLPARLRRAQPPFDVRERVVLRRLRAL